MELTLNFEYAGIDWQVEVDVNDEWNIEQVFKVEVYNKELNAYKKITCDLQKFEKEMIDQLYTEIEEERSAAAAFSDDMAYEQAREKMIFRE